MSFVISLKMSYHFSHFTVIGATFTDPLTCSFLVENSLGLRARICNDIPDENSACAQDGPDPLSRVNERRNIHGGWTKLQ